MVAGCLSAWSQTRSLTRRLSKLTCILLESGNLLVRDVMRGASLSSPSVAYRNLQKLVDLGLVVKDEYSNYAAKEKMNKKGYLWVGNTLMPSFVIFGFVFVGMLIAEIAVLIPHLILGSSIEEAFWLWIITTVAAALLFLVTAVRFRMKSKTQP